MVHYVLIHMHAISYDFNTLFFAFKETAARTVERSCLIFLKGDTLPFLPFLISR